MRTSFFRALSLLMILSMSGSFAAFADDDDGLPIKIESALPGLKIVTPPPARNVVMPPPLSLIYEHSSDASPHRQRRKIPPLSNVPSSVSTADETLGKRDDSAPLSPTRTLGPANGFSAPQNLSRIYGSSDRISVPVTSTKTYRAQDEHSVPVTLTKTYPSQGAVPSSNAYAIPDETSTSVTTHQGAIAVNKSILDANTDRILNRRGRPSTTGQSNATPLTTRVQDDYLSGGLQASASADAISSEQTPAKLFGTAEVRAQQQKNGSAQGVVLANPPLAAMTPLIDHRTPVPGVPLIGGVEKRDKLPGLGVEKGDSLPGLSAEKAKSDKSVLGGHDVWFRIPAWMAGSWQIKDKMLLAEVDLRTGKQKLPKQMTFGYCFEPYGLQRDESGAYWQFQKVGGIPSNLKFDDNGIAHFMAVDYYVPISSSNTQLVLQKHWRNVSMDAITKEIITQKSMQSILTFTLTGEDQITVEENVTTFNRAGEPINRRIVQTVRCRVQPYKEVANLHGQDVRASFSEYMANRAKK